MQGPAAASWLAMPSGTLSLVMPCCTLATRALTAALRPPFAKTRPSGPQVVDFFAARGISGATLERNRVAQETLADGSTAIAFPYHR